MLSALAPARRRLVLAVVAAVAVVCAVAITVLVRELAGQAVTPVSQDQPGPVLLVPGYGGSVEDLAPIATMLDGMGRDVTVVDLAGDGTGDLRTQAQLLAETADDALARTGAGSVDVVGYSAGGVIARLWVRDYGGAGQARRVVTLGSPHHGTDVAGLASEFTPGSCPVACEQLSPDSELLRRLNAGDETPVGPAFVAVWTTLDGVVTPPDSAALDGALNLTVQSVCPDSVAEHGDLPGEPAVRAILTSTLAADSPSPPSACPA